MSKNVDKITTMEEVNQKMLAVESMHSKMLVVDALYKKILPSFNALMEAASKSVEITLDAAVMKEMKKNNYKLCFAKKVGEFDYNVVWQSYDDYLENNTFSWLPLYSVFGSNKFEEAVKVRVSCKPVTIGLGQITTLDKDGALSTAIDGGTATALTIKNEYKAIHPGVSQMSYGLDGQQIATPIYLSKQAAVSGTIELTPKEKVLIWFEQNIETSTILSGSKSNAMEVDLTFKNSASITYDGKMWKVTG